MQESMENFYFLDYLLLKLITDVFKIIFVSDVIFN
jgi:hypothetical protein